MICVGYAQLAEAQGVKQFYSGVTSAYLPEPYLSLTALAAKTPSPSKLTSYGHLSAFIPSLSAVVVV